MGDEAAAKAILAKVRDEAPPKAVKAEYPYTCDRCGATMVERNCKVLCTNCGHRYDCSDLNIYFD